MTRLAFELDDAAETEFYNIVDYYKQFDRSLSSDFIQEFDRAVQRLPGLPKAALLIYMVQSVLFSGGFRTPSFIKSIGMK